jgi:acetate---CoA ligase (ADP-forming)
MNTFFYPRSMVVIGASVTKMNLGQIVLLNNIRNGYEGSLYGVGSLEGEIEGVRVYKDVDSLPEAPEVAIILTPAKTVPTLMESCGRKGIRRIVIESGGFSEYSHGDHSLEEEVLEIARKYGMKVIGPNCVGVVNFDIKMMMPFGFFKGIPPVGGRVALIVQSGGVGSTYLRAFSAFGVKPGKFVSIGNKLQLDEADFLDYFIRDEKTEVITLYLEGFNRGREFYNLALRSEKPIIVQKSNRSPSSAKIAQSHTTALSSLDDVVDGLFRQAAVIRAEDESDFIDAVKIIRLPPMRGRRVAVLSRSGGHAVLTADACAKYGFEMIQFPLSFIEKLKTIYNTRVIAHQNPLDLGEIFDYTIFTIILEEALKLEEVDGVLFNHLYSSDYESGMSRTFLSGVEKLVEKYRKPVSLAMISDRHEIMDVSMNHPYPIFTSPLEAAEALNVSATYHERKAARDKRGTEAAYEIDILKIQDIMKGCIKEGRIPLTDEALAVCAAAGLNPMKGKVISGDASVGDMDFDYPVVLKLLSRDASHKSDVGGVRVNIGSGEALLTAVSDMKEAMESLNPLPAIDGFLIQEMAKSGIECFVGGRRDPVFGPIVMAGLGGVFIEIFKDTAIRLAPVTEREARDMLRELRAYSVLEGTRGKRMADMEALVEVICRVSSLMAVASDISEMDINPVIVHPVGEGVSIVDARVFFD